MEQIVCNLDGKVRRATAGGREYLVAPLSMIVPGVLSGSKGALYYPPEEVAQNHQQWDRIPLLVYHPIHNGEHVSASYPGILDKQEIGFVIKSHIDKLKNNSLRGEGWFDVERTRKVDPRVLMALEQGRPIELSTGLFTTNEPAPPGANHNGQSYEWIARNYKADHVAILPDQIGACSINDGCGVLVGNGESLIGNTWSDAAREASIEARRANKSGDEGSKERASLSNKASMLSEAAGVVGTKEVHYAAAQAHRDARDAYEKSGHLYAAFAHGNAAADHSLAVWRNENPKPGKPYQASVSAANSAVETHNAKEGETAPEPTTANPAKPKLIKPPSVGSAQAASDEEEYREKIHNEAALDESQAFLIYNARWDQQAREKLGKEAPDDFAGPHHSFPIRSQEDVDHAAKLIGHADDPEAVKARIAAIAKRKNLSLPDSWKGATVENLTANIEFVNDDERRAAFAHMSGESSSASTKSAASASKNAIKNGSAESHKSAAHAHRVAAKEASDKGNETLAESHSAAAKWHANKARAAPGLTYHQQGTNQENPVEKELLTLANNCACEATKNQLLQLVANMPAANAKAPENMSDDELDSHHQRIVGEKGKRQAIAQKFGMPPDAHDADEPEPGATANDGPIHSFDTKPVKTGSMQAGGKGSKDEYTGNMAKWLKSVNAPREVVETLTLAANVERDHKLEMVHRLIANVADKDERNRIGNQLMHKSARELRDLLNLLPVDNSQAYQLNYQGASPSTGVENVQVNADDILPLPVMNWSEQAS